MICWTGETLYAVAFEPTSGAIVAHHMKMYSCAPGMLRNKLS